LGTYAVHIIGSEGVVLTDIGFNPKDHQLYGVSFTSLYRVNLTTGKATFIGNLGISDANALVFNGQGAAYTAGVDETELYTINLKTGFVNPVGSTYPFKSAGDDLLQWRSRTLRLLSVQPDGLYTRHSGAAQS
jgi:hypothetical protein